MKNSPVGGNDKSGGKGGASYSKLPGQLGVYGGRVLIILPLFIFAVFLGFSLELVTVERLSLYTRFPLLISTRREPCCYYEGAEDSKHHLHPENLEQAKEMLEARKPPWERSTLLNITNFAWLRNNASICDQNGDSGIRILPVLVHSARSHFAERMTIRKSWGSLLRFKKWAVRLVFLLGEADRGLDPSRNVEKFEEQEMLLDKEQSHFGDIVAGSYVDCYKNLTYKHIMGYKWILNFCADATFVMKVDDDMFIDILRIIRWRSEDLSPSADHSLRRGPPVPDLYCNTFVGTKPQRCVGCKWYSTESEWPQDYYPDYCSGWCYSLTVDLIRKLYSVLDKVPFFWVDDVFATGVLMEQVKKEYGHGHYQPHVRHMWGQVRALDFKNFRPMCELEDMKMKRTFGTVVPVARGSNFERDMICLWNKTRYDHEHHLYENDYSRKIKKKGHKT